MFLSEVANLINTNKIINLSCSKKINKITSTSKNASFDTLLVIDSKKKFKIDYLKEAIDKKIPAIISKKKFNNIKITQFIVSNVNIETYKLLNYLFPIKPKKTIAITGTNGKTSVAWYLSQFCKKNKTQSKMLGTLGYYKNHKKIEETSLTTPSFEDLYQYAYEKKENQYKFIFEASSHALNQNRLRSIKVDIGAITNISNDHIDYHKNLLKYKEAKFSLFNKFLDSNGTAILNSRLEDLNVIKKITRKRKIKTIIYGSKDVFFEYKNKLYLNVFKKKYLLKNLNINEFEKQNIECAIACAIHLNINLNLIIKSLNTLKNPPGRSQKINFKKRNGIVIIDYAHTPDALKNILEANTVNNNKPSVVFGCGGNRDISKRKLMGSIANKYASRIYITDDNPRNENPEKIRKEILKYCAKGVEIPDRKKAIKTAIHNMDKNNILILAGKGHEKYQIIKNNKIAFDDFKIAKKIIDKV